MRGIGYEARLGRRGRLLSILVALLLATGCGPGSSATAELRSGTPEARASVTSTPARTPDESRTTPVGIITTPAVSTPAVGATVARADAATPIRTASPVTGATYAADFGRWPVGQTVGIADAAVEPTTGAYHLALRDPTRAYDFATPERLAPADVTIEVDVRADAAPADGYAGIALRRTVTHGTLSVIQVGLSRAGGLVVRSLLPDGTTVHQRAGSGVAAARTGDATNHLAVTARGDTLAVAVNGVDAGSYPALVAGPGSLGLVLIDITGAPAGMGATFAGLRATPLDATAVPTPLPAGLHPATPIAPVSAAPHATTPLDFGAWPVDAVDGRYAASRAFDPADGSYQVALTNPALGYFVTFYAPAQPRYSDLTLDVDARRLEGPDDTAAGLVARVTSYGPPLIGDASYVFLVRADGAATLFFDAPDGARHVLLPVTPFAAIHRGDAPNHLRLTCRGATITIAVNGTTLGTYPAEAAWPGRFGVATERATAGAAARVAYTNLVVSPAP
jgi:hypothetical protein